MENKYQVIRYKCCNKLFAACATPECYTDDSWTSTLKEYVSNGHRVEYVDSISDLNLSKCTCGIDKANEISSPILDYLRSEEGMKSAREYFDNIKNRKLISESQIKRLHEDYIPKYGFDNIVEKVINKYDSDVYSSRWLYRSIEPPTSLLFFLNKYVKKYGRKANKKEYKKYGNMFTGSLYIHGSYVFNVMNGQGTVIRVDKIN